MSFGSLDAAGFDHPALKAHPIQPHASVKATEIPQHHSAPVLAKFSSQVVLNFAQQFGQVGDMGG